MKGSGWRGLALTFVSVIIVVFQLSVPIHAYASPGDEWDESNIIEHPMMDFSGFKFYRLPGNNLAADMINKVNTGDYDFVIYLYRRLLSYKSKI